ncbi:hypothetical protein EBAPG3_008135 [Nitrosospira lacus]|uniref:CYTH domain-containing protein n=1 Tax=Nitrosospira lacus TaxID=1288494 RepID=A0A1W6SPK2_9PROT|nr:hypothetical protein [Nitrosospira lacus]ARO87738.1 hypothetical protein EBAPG3_008135 [Nitrosospira lacus]
MIAQIIDMPREILDAGNTPLDAPVFRLAAVNEIMPRFEFRIFGHGFNKMEQRIRKAAPCESINESREIYILGNENSDRNVKIREGKLEFKRLIDRVNGLERWKPTGSMAFPIERAAIPDSLFPVSALERALPFPDSLTAMVTEKEFLHHVTQDSLCGHRLYRANVFKRRSRFTLQDCPVEIDWILVNGAAIESIAIESPYAEQVLTVQSALGLEQFENVAYPLAVSRILGIRPLPDAKGYE